jgi:hypothetical protein
MLAANCGSEEIKASWPYPTDPLVCLKKGVNEQEMRRENKMCSNGIVAMELVVLADLLNPPTIFLLDALADEVHG